jgi:para-nitrobenzyl esterase
MNDDTRTVAAAPERYTVQFAADGTVRVLADCNRGNGRYETDWGRRLVFGPIATTRKMCPPGTQDAQFLRGLANISGYLIDGADLVLMLKFDSGTMRLRATP